MGHILACNIEFNRCSFQVILFSHFEIIVGVCHLNWESEVSLVAHVTVTLSFLCFLSSSRCLFLFVFNHSGNASWTYSCEYFRYPKIPSQTGIWREPLESGVAPTSPDDWPCAQANSLTRVSIYTSTHAVCEAAWV